MAVECIGRVFNQMMCSDPQVDSHRFMDIIDSALSSGEFSLCSSLWYFFLLTQHSYLFRSQFPGVILESMVHVIVQGCCIVTVEKFKLYK